MSTLALHRELYTNFTQESKAIFRTSFPLMFCKVGFMSLGLVDAAMLGEVGVNEFAGSGIARSFFLPLSVFFMGVLFSIDVFSSHAVGANRKGDIEKIFCSGMQMAFVLSFIFSALAVAISFTIPLMGFKDNIAGYARDYLYHISFGAPLLVFNLSIQRFLMSQKIIVPFVFIIIASNILNYYLNRAFIFGDYGAKALGVVGAAQATNLSRAFVFICCSILCVHYFKFTAKNILHLKNLIIFESKAIWQMFWFGLPGGGQRVLEVAFFSLLTMFASRLSITEMAAHHVAMLLLNFFHNFPLALSSTAILRIGGFIGKNQVEQARFAGYCSIFWGATFMAMIAGNLFFSPEHLLGTFSSSSTAVVSAKSIAWILGACIILDGLLGCAMGALRGAGDSRVSFYASLVGYYPVGLVSSYIFCFWFDWGLQGLWLGLFFGFFSVSFFVVSFWMSFKPKLILIKSESK